MLVNFRKIFKDKIFIGSVVFVIFLYCYEEIIFNFPQLIFLQIIFTLRPFDEKLIVGLSGVASVLLCFWFTWISLGLSRKFQIIALFLFSVSSLVQYGFWKAVGRFMSSIDLQIATSASFETWNGAKALYFNWQFIVPTLGFIAILSFFSVQRPKTTNLKQTFLLSLFLITLCFTYTFTRKTLSLGASFPSFYQTIVHFAFEKIQSPMRNDLGFQKSHIPSNNIVLIIDESIRGDHLNINGYYRDTTPFLTQLSAENDIVRNWGLAVAGATCSHPSNALILTGVRPGVDEFEMTNTHPTLFQYAQAMGYKTYYIDAQTSAIWNGLNTSDFKYINVWIKASELGDDIQSDFRAADAIRDLLLKSAGNFIVLNKRGVHFLYENSYPANQTIWSPVPTDYQNQPELVANPYDNGIHYNVNTFFERLLSNLHILKNTVFLYTSDHGQTLFENNATWLHCNYTTMEATVPLLMIGKDLPLVATKNFLASHSNIFPTLLDLMEVPPEQRTYIYAPSLFSLSSKTEYIHFFLNGALYPIKFPGQ